MKKLLIRFACWVLRKYAMPMNTYYMHGEFSGEIDINKPIGVVDEDGDLLINKTLK